ncbi:MAG: response regulator [Desulfobacteraceae bacterium]|nr:response regulator [Desulfobacteraceae bacterium]
MDKSILPSNAPVQMTTSRRERVDQERIHLLYKQSPMGLTASTVIAAITIFLLRHTISPALLTGWFIAIMAVSALRLLLILRFPRPSPTLAQSRAWSRCNDMTLLLSGCLWGAASWLLFPLESEVHQFFLVVALCGMVAGAAMAFAVMIRAFVCFSVPAIVPLIIRLVTIPDEVHFSMGFIAVLFWLLSYLIAANYRRARMNLLSLKEDLADRVAERTLNLEKLNVRLRAENRHRKRMEEILRQERDRLETITSSLGAGIAVISKEYNVQWANKVLQSIFGQVEGRSYFDTIYHGMEKEQCNAVKVLEGRVEKAVREQEIRDAQGQPAWFQIISTPLRDGSGRISAALELVLPITELRKAQEEKQRIAIQLGEVRKLEAIATLAGGMAHKFNNALAVIMGNTELIGFEYGPTGKIDTYLKPIVSSATQMSQLTDQLLAYAKGGKYKARATDMTAFIEETMALLKHTLPMEIEVAITIDKPLPFVKMDVTQMQMALSAIVSNAIEALPKGGHIHVHCRKQTLEEMDHNLFGEAKSGDYVTLKVVDNGVGMDENTLQRIFEPFFSTKFMGRGLGMAAVYGIVQNHGGHVAISSQVNRGTQVTIYLPASPEAGPVAAKPKIQRPAGHYRVLLIEDEDLVRQVNHTILTRLGYTVIAAATGKEAIQKIRDPKCLFDVILLDIKLPDMDGLTIYPIARTHRPEAKVIVCSGYALDGPTQALMDVGADGFIQKPFSVERLAEKLNEALSAAN